MSATDPNARAQALQHWLQDIAPAHQLQLESLQPASSDASFRRYFRVQAAGGSLIVMDAPPPMENVRPFVRVAQLLAEGGVQAPQVLEQDVAQGFLLLTDLGQTTYLQAINAQPDRADSLMRDARGALVSVQRIDGAGVVPVYDAALLQRELDLFPQWFVQRHHGHVLSDAQSVALQGIFARLYHRDGKAQYLGDLPVVLQHTRLVAARYGAFKPLLQLLDQIEQRSPLVGYTF